MERWHFLLTLLMRDNGSPSSFLTAILLGLMITDKKPQFVYSVAAVHMIFDVFLKSSNFASSHSYVGEIFPSLEQ